jgi:hypothetical protein
MAVLHSCFQGHKQRSFAALKNYTERHYIQPLKLSSVESPLQSILPTFTARQKLIDRQNFGFLRRWVPPRKRDRICASVFSEQLV